MHTLSNEQFYAFLVDIETDEYKEHEYKWNEKGLMQMNVSFNSWHRFMSYQKAITFRTGITSGIMI